MVPLKVRKISLIEQGEVLYDPFLTVSHDGRAYACSASRFLNSLYLVTGLR